MHRVALANFVLGGLSSLLFLVPRPHPPFVLPMGSCLPRSSKGQTRGSKRFISLRFKTYNFSPFTHSHLTDADTLSLFPKSFFPPFSSCFALGVVDTFSLHLLFVVVVVVCHTQDVPTKPSRFSFLFFLFFMFLSFPLSTD